MVTGGAILSTPYSAKSNAAIQRKWSSLVVPAIDQPKLSLSLKENYWINLKKITKHMLSELIKNIINCSLTSFL